MHEIYSDLISQVITGTHYAIVHIVILVLPGKETGKDIEIGNPRYNAFGINMCQITSLIIPDLLRKKIS